MCSADAVSNCVVVLLEGASPTDDLAVMKTLLFHDAHINDWCRSVSYLTLELHFPCIVKLNFKEILKFIENPKITSNY